MTTPRTVLVVGNPRPASRTRAAGEQVVTGLTGRGPDLVVELADLGAELLDWTSERVTGLVEQVAAADLVVVASPTYKTAYTGLLKLFLDRFAIGQVAGVVVPLMLVAAPQHALAPELVLRPVLAEISSGPVLKGLAVHDAAYDDPASYATWLDTVRPTTDRLLGAVTPSPETTGARA
ncbi:NAD(P)H-dependent oxidoreductase [uncultured Nocardioides sp.]|uniref:NADPH-dependent FMN reductase n=1 Tax=uncultured Nocardioides sp. TaxID=198441 RepID=UPI00260C10D4|nr:NAD(P)H-dependent oxidoreductase [uncultured Nocardioides sp.]